MTPKEKANHLLKKFNAVSCLCETWDLQQMHLISKRAALISADECLQIVFEKDFEDSFYWHKTDYWKAVKEEIEKL